MLERHKRQDPFFLAAISPLLLTCALAALFFHLTPILFPFVLLALLGLALTWTFGKKGLLLALISLAALTVWRYAFVHQHLWCSLFLASIALSWVTGLIARKEARERIAKSDEQHARVSQSALQELTAIQDALQAAKSEARMWIDRCEALALELSASKERNTEPSQAVIPQESEPEDLSELMHLHMSYRQLQTQFQEKADLLTQARKELFKIEGELFLAQREQQEQTTTLLAHEFEFHQHLHALSQECQALECEVVDLEQIIAHLLTAKKKPSPRKGKKALSSVLKSAIHAQQYSLLD